MRFSVHTGILEERAYMSTEGEITADTGIKLRRGGVVLLNPGAVTSFVPNPDHIHVTGVPAERETCVSLHLYGRNMNSFHVYDVAAGTRKLIDVPTRRAEGRSLPGRERPTMFDLSCGMPYGIPATVRAVNTYRTSTPLRTHMHSLTL